MHLWIILHGVLIGLIISFPNGPVGFLCVRRALLHHYRASFSSALGSISADMIFGIIAIFGLTAVSHFFIRELNVIRFFGGIILIYIGIKTYFDILPEVNLGLQKYEHVGNFASTFFLVMTNPIQIITLPIVFASIGTGIRPENYSDALFFLLGLFVGACICWVLLILFANFLKKYIKDHHFDIINKISGTAITGVGLYVLLGLILRWFR